MIDKGDKVVCVNNIGRNGSVSALKIGEVYIVRYSSSNISRRCYSLKGMDGRFYYFDCDKFVSLTEHRTMVINEILE